MIHQSSKNIKGSNRMPNRFREVMRRRCLTCQHARQAIGSSYTLPSTLENSIEQSFGFPDPCRFTILTAATKFTIPRGTLQCISRNRHAYLIRRVSPQTSIAPGNRIFDTSQSTLDISARPFHSKFQLFASPQRPVHVFSSDVPDARLASFQTDLA